MNKVKMSLYDMEQIKNSANFYNKDADTYIAEYIENSTTSMTREKFNTTLDILMECDELISDNTKIIINQLRDPAVFDKAIFVSDGSYRKNRVWLYMNDETIDLYVEINRCNIDYYNIPIENRIKYILDNYDNIFIQIHNFQNKKEIIDWIEWNKEKRKWCNNGYKRMHK